MQLQRPQKCKLFGKKPLQPSSRWNFSTFSKTRQLELWPRKRTVVYLRDNQSIGECIDILEKENILSAPVLNSSKLGDGGDPKAEALMGVIDVLDFMVFLSTIYPNQVDSAQDLTPLQLQELYISGKKFDENTAGDVLALSTEHQKLKHEDDIFPLYLSSTDDSIKLITFFFFGMHRVPIVDNGKLTNVITQSDMISVFGSCIPLFSTAQTNATLGDLDLVNKLVHSVDSTEQVFSILAKMKHVSPRLSAVPVVDKEGKLVANFSASVLKGVKRAHVYELSMPVLEFLRKQPPKADSLLRKIGYAKSMHPITCKLNTTLEMAVLKMIAYKVHRLWCVDDQNKLIGVISMSDVVRSLLPYEKLVEDLNCFIV